MKDTIYYKQVKLLINLLPLIHKEKNLALKGGTAINLFFRSIPRLSVDIDLAYLPISKRETSLRDIAKVLKRIKVNINRLFPNAIIKEKALYNTKYITGLFVREGGTLVKIEVNTTIRGSVNPPVEISLSEKASELFEMDLFVQCLSFDDVYAGKICAALDRQHPRDFYDIKLLLDDKGINNNLRKTFIVYLISSNRPIIELLNPNYIDINDTFNQEFSGMTTDKVTIDELLKSRNNLIKSIHSSLSTKEIEFLLSFKNKKPKWNLLGFKSIENLPAVKWKLINLEKMSEDKHTAAYNKLESFLNTLITNKQTRQ